MPDSLAKVLEKWRGGVQLSAEEKKRVIEFAKVINWLSWPEEWPAARNPLQGSTNGRKTPRGFRAPGPVSVRRDPVPSKEPSRRGSGHRSVGSSLDTREHFKFPKDVQDEVRETLTALRAIVPREQVDSYLDTWHRNSSRPADGLGRVTIPVETQLLIDRYVRACERLARYNSPGGPARHVSAGVAREVNRLRGKRSKRGRMIPYEAIIVDLEAIDYDNLPHGHKKGKISDLAKKHKVSERTISAVITAKRSRASCSLAK